MPSCAVDACTPFHLVLFGGDFISRCHVCICAAGRRIRWRVLGLIIKAAEIGLFVCNLKKLTFSSKG